MVTVQLEENLMTSEVTTTQFERSIEMFTGDPAKMWLFPKMQIPTQRKSQRTGIPATGTDILSNFEPTQIGSMSHIFDSVI